MRKLLPLIVSLLCLCVSATALDRQGNVDYRARREALAKKAAGIVLLFAPLEPIPLKAIESLSLSDAEFVSPHFRLIRL